jgi:transcriptional regulator with GAF, ATPase, and Fis domain/tetratricopeptide (TPR) repeat protein
MSISESLPDLTRLQWNFLSIISAFGIPVSINVVEALAPLPLSEYLDMRRKCDAHGWIHQTEKELLSLSEELPESIQSKLSTINSSAKIEEIINLLESSKLVDQVPRQAFAKLLKKSGQKGKTLQLEMELALEALRENNLEVVPKHLEETNRLISSTEVVSLRQDWFIALSIELSRHCMARIFAGKLLPPLLKEAIRAAEHIGDQRKCAIATLFLGRCYWDQNRMNKSISFLAKGKEMAEALGDPDILDQAASCIGLYYWIQGRFSLAIDFFETVAQNVEEARDYTLGFEPLVLLVYCYVFQGDFYRAIGKIDYFRFSAIRSRDFYAESGYRAVLGTILLFIHKREEALYHLEGSQTQALAANNRGAYWLSLMGLSSLYLIEGDREKGRLMFEMTLSVAKKMGHAHQIYHPFILESHFVAEQLGCKPLPGWQFDSLFHLVMSGPSIHLQGTALRLRAMKNAAMGRNKDKILTDLTESKKLLEECGDPTELSKTLLEMARLYLKQKDDDTARSLCYDAYQKLSGYGDIFFPDDLRFLLEDKLAISDPETKTNEVLDSFIQVLEELLTGPASLDPNFLLRVLSRFLRAEHSCIFMFGDKTEEPPSLLAARNLSEHFIGSENFRDNLVVVYKCFHEKKLIKVQLSDSAMLSSHGSTLQILCVPVIYKRRVAAILYFDNSYLEKCFDLAENPILKRLNSHLTKFIKKFIHFREPNEKIKPLSAEKNTHVVLVDHAEIIGESPGLIQTLRKAKRFSSADASVLILGETGVGKDLLAQFIHRNSPRNEHSFVVVDLSMMPENLVESELFGHEKGAFTGADRQKIGRAELAHRGTLFIDEIGEIPQNLQVKLLRLIEEKSFTRIGGTKTITSDFRLIAATNRDLLGEVVAGRFREDLYYRLHVLELLIPSLRQRVEDIVPIARHFMAHYAKKYKQPRPVLSAKQEAALREYHWPGNVRELKNVIERAVLVADSECIEFDFICRPEYVENLIFSDILTMDEMQKRYIAYILKKTGGRVGGPDGAAKILGMKRNTLNHRIKKLGVNSI